MDRKITGTVMQGGKFYRAGDEDALYSIMSKRPRAETQRLLDKGRIEGAGWLSEIPAVARAADPENGVEDASVDSNDGATTKPTAKKAAKRARKK